MGELYLSVELTLDALACVLGIILMIRAGDNHPKFFWGLIAAAIGGVFIWENVGWLLIVQEQPEYRFMDMLNMEKMLKWYPMASIVSLFPLAALTPGYLNPFRTVLMLLPSLLLTTVGVSYMAFNGEMTPLTSWQDIVNHRTRTDVFLRGLIFVFSVVTPLASFLLPMIFHQGVRRVNRMMYCFLAFMLVFVVIYIWFTWDISYFVFNLFGATAIVFTVFFSIQYVRYENPFAHCVDREQIPQAASVAVASGEPVALFYRVETFFKAENPFVDPAYSIHHLSERLQEKEQSISAAVKSAGFSSFREYLNDWRLGYFRTLAVDNPEKNVKELLFLSGFNSRATFYRVFSDKYGVSPTQFLDTLRTSSSSSSLDEGKLA